ncbi:hypothetical protein Bca52824_059264 [Brassica carinata]|uniref:Uncharacterized protein n=1 Tax=Brassica carinata TaxID=52824 RepID=A0A8X7QU10_BRACI|nr:hypothetical protein Bca52824_059264 [Brassica carinata]
MGLHRISGDVNAPNECEAESTNPCVNKAKALPLKIISIVAILLTSMIGVSAPLFSRDVSFLHPDGNTFTSMLSSECLEDDPWQKFPFTGFVAMLSVTSHSAIMATSFYSSKTGSEIVPAAGNGDQERANPIIAHGHSHRHGVTLTTKDDSGSQLLGYRANGMGLGGCILQMCGCLCLLSSFLSLSLSFLFSFMFFFKLRTDFRDYPNKHTLTTPFGIVLGIALSSIYRDNSPAALITVGLFNASAEFMGPKLQGSIKLQIKCFFAALLGCGGMSILAKRA